MELTSRLGVYGNAGSTVWGCCAMASAHNAKGRSVAQIVVDVFIFTFVGVFLCRTNLNTILPANFNDVPVQLPVPVWTSPLPKIKLTRSRELAPYPSGVEF
jgi:hypothetical protein